MYYGHAIFYASPWFFIALPAFLLCFFREEQELLVIRIIERFMPLFADRVQEVVSSKHILKAQNSLVQK